MKDKELEVPLVRRPRLRLSELPNGQGAAVGIMMVLIVFLALASGVLGACRVLGSDIYDTVDSPAVWQARQQEAAAQTYDEYVAEQDRQNDLSGALLLGVSPMIVVLGVLLYLGGTGEYTKCPQGHATRKEYSYCPQCGGNVYQQRELSPDEWEKRYGHGGEAHC